MLIYGPNTRREKPDLHRQKPVLEPLDLKGGETILIGDTRLRLVPFCGANFSWLS